VVEGDSRLDLVLEGETETLPELAFPMEGEREGLEVVL